VSEQGVLVVVKAAGAIGEVGMTEDRGKAQFAGRSNGRTHRAIRAKIPRREFRHSFQRGQLVAQALERRKLDSKVREGRVDRARDLHTLHRQIDSAVAVAGDFDGLLAGALIRIATTRIFDHNGKVACFRLQGRNAGANIENGAIKFDDLATIIRIAGLRGRAALGKHTTFVHTKTADDRRNLIQAAIGAGDLIRIREIFDVHVFGPFEV
jgi:hypothetical protein